MTEAAIVSNGKTVLVTGASTGIGRACALELARLGFRVFAGVRSEEAGTSLTAEAAGSLRPVILDVTDDQTIRAAADLVGREVGSSGLAGLVNNAGIAVGGPLEFLPIERLRRQFEVNVIGQIAVTQRFLPLIRAARGRVVFVGSVAGRVATPFMGPYGASKFALEALTDALRGELRRWGIHVSIVEPGAIDTPIWNKGRDFATELRSEMPAEAETLYAPVLNGMSKMIDKVASKGIPPAKVAAVVTHALTAGTPKTRYLVGMDARIQAALGRMVPDRLRDILILKFLGADK